MARSSTSGQGRPKGAANKATVEIKGLAQKYGPAALQALAELGGLTKDKKKTAVSETARVSAIGMLMDRGYGKATQPMEHSVDEGLEALLDRLASA